MKEYTEQAVFDIVKAVTDSTETFVNGVTTLRAPEGFVWNHNLSSDIGAVDMFLKNGKPLSAIQGLIDKAQMGMQKVEPQVEPEIPRVLLGEYRRSIVRLMELNDDTQSSTRAKHVKDAYRKCLSLLDQYFGE